MTTYIEMLSHLGYFLLALAGFGLLITLHELGHFWIARREGMIVEVFSIGWGKAIYSWMRKGVRWQICWLPLGGYVKIAGMHEEKGKDPQEIEGGFYSKTPMQRLRVAVAGPVANILLALVLFTVVWGLGGREKRFLEFTHRVGWVDPKSSFYAEGMRSGDQIESIGGRPFQGLKSLMVASIMKMDPLRITGLKNKAEQEKPFVYEVSPKNLLDKQVGSLVPASYLVVDQFFAKNAEVGDLQKGDRIIWADGEAIYSPIQLRDVINSPTAFLTVQRGKEIFQTRVARVPLSALKLTFFQRGEIDDWQHEISLRKPIKELYFIPYMLSSTGQIESALEFVDEQEEAQIQTLPGMRALQEGDVVLAVDNKPVDSAYEFLQGLQERNVLLVVDRAPNLNPILWNEADQVFDSPEMSNQLQQMVRSIGTKRPVTSSGHLVLVPSVKPKPFGELLPELAEKESEAVRKQLFLGVNFTDRKVIYNPNPLEQFRQICDDTWHTIASLFSGSLSPKAIAGPVGIMSIVHHSWMVGMKEGLFWLGVISFNLGFMNLLPIPMLDGGYITFSLTEMVLRRRLKTKMVERIVIPFMFLLIGFFVFVTYQDVLRIFFK